MLIPFHLRHAVRHAMTLALLADAAARPGPHSRQFNVL